MKLEKETTAIFVASTFGNGDPPSNGITFKQYLERGDRKFESLNYAVFGLGSTLYPHPSTKNNIKSFT